MKIHYEPHPVSPERVKELRAMRVQIIDAKFAPKDAVIDAPETNELTRDRVANMRTAGLKPLLQERGLDTEGEVQDLRDRLIAHLEA